MHTFHDLSLVFCWKTPRCTLARAHRHSGATYPGSLRRKLCSCTYAVFVYLSPAPRFPAPQIVSPLPPLDRLRFFEAASRHRSFVPTAKELGVTAAADDRIRTLERHLDAELFERRRRSVHLDRRGRAYRCLETEARFSVPASRRRMTQAIAGARETRDRRKTDTARASKGRCSRMAIPLRHRSAARGNDRGRERNTAPAPRRGSAGQYVEPGNAGWPPPGEARPAGLSAGP